MTEEKKIEEAEINAYMDLMSADGEAPTLDERRAYLWRRYKEVQADYKFLMLQKEEAEAKKSEETLNRITHLFRENYKSRKWIVRELQLIGEVVNDKFVPKATV